MDHSLEATTRDVIPDPALPREDPVFEPVARAMDLIGERWTLVLVRHLLGGPRGFQQLKGRTGIAPRVLSTRLRQLIERGFVQTVKVGNRHQYALTESGRELAPIVRAIARWWVLNRMEHLGPFRETSAASVIESLPFMLNEERARGVRINYEVRLTGWLKEDRIPLSAKKAIALLFVKDEQDEKIKILQEKLDNKELLAIVKENQTYKLCRYEEEDFTPVWHVVASDIPKLKDARLRSSSAHRRSARYRRRIRRGHSRSWCPSGPACSAATSPGSPLEAPRDAGSGR